MFTLMGVLWRKYCNVMVKMESYVVGLIAHEEGLQIDTAELHSLSGSKSSPVNTKECS